MLILDQKKIKKEEFYGVQETINIWNVDFSNIDISKLTETKNDSKYLIGYLDEVIRAIDLILPKISGYVKTFKEKDGEKDKNKNNNLKKY